jgi:hypothetical protein
MFFEPIANSPPSYLLEGPGGLPTQGPHIAGGKLWEPAPAQLESTLSWMGAMSFGAPYVVNFILAVRLHLNLKIKSLLHCTGAVCESRPVATQCNSSAQACS